MNEWLRRNWKLLLAAVAAFVIVLLLYLLTRSGRRGASTISFPANPAAAGAAGAEGAAAAAASDAAAAVQGFFGKIRSPGGVPSWDPTHKGIPLWTGVGIGPWLALIPYGQTVEILDTAQGPPNAVDQDTTYYLVSWGGLQGWISSFDIERFLGLPPAGFGNRPQTKPFPLQTVQASSGASRSLGRLPVGGPGMVYGNLQRAALAAQTASHQAALRSPRLARRLAHDARQAATEGSRIAHESRGPAPTPGGPTALVGRWRR